MNKEMAIKTLREESEKAIIDYTRWAKEEKGDTDQVICAIEKIPEMLFKNARKVYKSTCLVLIFWLPLDKKLITEVKKTLQENDFDFRVTEDFPRSYDIYFDVDEVDARLYFKASVEGATCSFQKIGEEKVEITRGIYEISCNEAA